MQLLSKVFSVKMVYRQLITIILSIYKNFSLQSVYIKHNQSLYSCFNELLLVYFLLHIIDDLLPIYQ